MKIAFIGKFARLYDEEYIARSFEMLGHEVIRIPQHLLPQDIGQMLKQSNPDILLYCKWEQPASLDGVISSLQRAGMKTVCWIFDLYYGYPRAYQAKTKRFFKSDYVFTTDGGHDEEWEEAGINHHCVRQGIYAPECYIEPFNPIYDVLFVGSENPYYPERNDLMSEMAMRYNFKWVGRRDTDEVRGPKLNTLFAQARVVIGDSVISPYYWSNRIVETLGRGGMLVHKDVPGLRAEYPGLVTYETDIFLVIDDILLNPERYAMFRQLNCDWVKNNYTMDKQCQKLLNFIS